MKRYDRPVYNMILYDNRGQNRTQPSQNWREREGRRERKRERDVQIDINKEREILQTLYIRTSCGSGGRMSS